MDTNADMEVDRKDEEVEDDDLFGPAPPPKRKPTYQGMIIFSVMFNV